MWTIAVKIALSESECFHIGGDKVNVISSIVEGLERRGRHNVNRVAVSCVVLNNELFIFVYPLQHMVVDQHMTQPFLFRCLNH